MSQNARESLSALMDNEGDELELRRVLKSLEEAPDAAEAWRRYHLMRSLMRREGEMDVSTDLSAGILSRLEEEPAPGREVDLDNSAIPASRRSLPLARSAGIAAAVSLMVITGVQFYNGGLPGASVGQPAEVAGAGAGQAAPASLAAAPAAAEAVRRPALADLPLFSLPQGDGGLMTVGAGGSATPMFMASSQRQSLMADEEQARLLQSYLDRHAEGAAYRSGDAWMPLLRATGADGLGQR
ncbi:sigma-E factor negative regulatory protein RseA [Halomonas shengliensis]|uniref:Sigma-E factor negative regulatory protein RseA n=1 Tax=Halomonas shengliensis TaxID=419597 RepID=A0A1H0LBK9_9GAMM|nr:sigma-E factor negative regulatory protein [Halomonas shengliensis]SDO65639.1 sigma-E factor negative regulatory protein RseA [Halomonas shengliensis]